MSDSDRRLYIATVEVEVLVEARSVDDARGILEETRAFDEELSNHLLSGEAEIAPASYLPAGWEAPAIAYGTADDTPAEKLLKP